MAVTPFDPPYPETYAACKHHGCMFDRTGFIADRSFTLQKQNIFDLFGFCDIDPMVG